MSPETVKAPARLTSTPPRRDLELASFEQYVAAVMAEGRRLFDARAGK
jgi:hypothetical protein